MNCVPYLLTGERSVSVLGRNESSPSPGVPWPPVHVSTALPPREAPAWVLTVGRSCVNHPAFGHCGGGRIYIPWVRRP